MERQAETRGIRYTQADSEKWGRLQLQAQGYGLCQRCSKYLKESQVPGEALELPVVIKSEHHELSGYSKGGKADYQVVRKDYQI